MKWLLFIQPDLKTRSLVTHPVLWTPPLRVESHGAYCSRGECAQLTPLSSSVNVGMQTCQELVGFVSEEGAVHGRKAEQLTIGRLFAGITPEAAFLCVVPMKLQIEQVSDLR